MDKKRNHTLQLIALCSGFIAMTLGVLFSSGGGLGKFFSKVTAGNDYILNLTYNNGGSSFSSAYSSSVQVNTSARTNKGSEIDFTYSNVKKSNNNYAVVANNGFLYNSTKLTGLETVTVNFSGSLSIYTSTSTTFNGSPASLTNGQEFAVDANNDYFKIVSSGETTISSIVATYKCAPRITVSYYEKIESNSDLTDGTYLIVYETGSCVFNGSGTDLSTMQTPQSVTISNSKIEATSAVDAWSVEISDNLTSICTSSGYYIGGTSGSNTINISSNKLTNSISIDESGDADIVSNTSHIRYNKSANQIKYYKSTTYTSQTVVALYKKASESGGGGGDTPVDDIASVTINVSNCGLPQSAGTTDVERSYLLSDGETYLDVVFSAGSYIYNDSAFRINKAYLEPTTPTLLVTKITIDFFASGQNYSVITADGEAVTGTESETSGSGVVQDFEINSTVWRVASQDGKYAGVYSITIYCQIETGPKAVTGVSLNETQLALTNESSETLVATVLPTNADNQNVTWSSANPSVASVDQNGHVQGVGAGSTSITVTTEDGGFTAVCSVSVTAVTHVTGVTLNTSALAMHPNDDQILTATVSPANASNKAVSWSTSNSSVATVSDGTVHAVAAGSATITVTTYDGEHIATCSVSVTNISVTGVSLNKSSTSITRLSSETLYATVAPNNATNKNVTWTSSNTSIATVTNGTVTAVATGSATITVTTNDGGYKASCTVTVTPIAVTGISLNKSSAGIYVGESETLVATVTPSNADNKTVTWTSDHTNIASVTSGGIVTANATGTATITASCSGFTATCTVTVTEKPATVDFSLVTSTSQLSVGAKIIVATSDSLGKAISTTQNTNNRAATSVTISNDKIDESSLSSSVEVFTLESGSTSGTYAFHCTDGYIYAASSGSNHLKTQTNKDGNASFSISVSSNGDATIVAQGTNTRNTMRYNPNNNSPIFACYAEGSTTGSAPRLYIAPTTPVNPTGISLPSSESMSLLGTKTIEVTYEPANCNQNKGVSWTSSDTTVATINATTGEITPKKAGTTVITATSTFNTNFTSSCTLTVTDNMDEWTILMYVCGADLESDSKDGGCATEDLQEIAGVSGQPNDVNIVVQAGGAKSWKSTYSSVINKDKANRFHLQNKSYVVDQQLEKKNMGLQSTFQDFLEWGIAAYPAQKIGVILWNHGGAMNGCCYDEQFSNDPLTSQEVHDAIAGAKQTTGYSNKFEFVGYDCCLMQVQDIAGLNSEYAKYQIASEESEWGYGWSYDGWVDDLFAKKTTPNILKAIVDSFKSDTNTSYASWGYTNDQTLSYLDLSYWAAYQNAWEDMSSTLSGIINSDSKWTTFASLLNSCQRFGYDSDYNSYDFDVFDVGSFCTNIKTNNNYKNNTALMSKISSVQTAYSNLVKYEFHGSGSSGATGLTMFAPVAGYSSTSIYTTGHTPFTTWRNICINYGTWYGA